jgi:putative ABC transport system permease protein
MHAGTAIKIGLRTARRRLLSIGSLIGAVAVAVGVLTATLAIPESFAYSALRIVDPERRVVWEDEAPEQELSGISRDIAARAIAQLAIRRGPSGEKLASTEVVRNVPVQAVRTGEYLVASVRGVTLPAAGVRPEMRIVEGRFPRPRSRELIVGRGLAARAGLTAGETVESINGTWQIVGVFSSAGSSNESELIGDIDVLMDALHVSAFNAIVYLPAQSAPDPAAETQGLLNAGVKAWVTPESRIIYRRYGLFTRQLNSIAYGIGAMIVAALLIGILNTFLIAVRRRAAELATLQALGFERASLIATVIVEAILCVFAGGLLGLVAVRALLGKAQISLFSGVYGSELTFDLNVSGTLALIALAITLAIALLVAVAGGMQASALTPATTLRRA